MSGDRVTGRGDPALHSMTDFAVVEDGRITYPSPDTLPI